MVAAAGVVTAAGVVVAPATGVVVAPAAPVVAPAAALVAQPLGLAKIVNWAMKRKMASAGMIQNKGFVRNRENTRVTAATVEGMATTQKTCANECRLTRRVGASKIITNDERAVGAGRKIDVPCDSTTAWRDENPVWGH